MNTITKSIMLTEQEIDRINKLVEMSKEVYLYHSFSYIVRVSMLETLDKVEKDLVEMFSKRKDSRVVKIMNKAMNIRERK